MNIADITPEIKERILACTNAEEAMSVLQEEGIELADEALDAISGGLQDPVANWLERMIKEMKKFN